MQVCVHRLVENKSDCNLKHSKASGQIRVQKKDLSCRLGDDHFGFAAKMFSVHPVLKPGCVFYCSFHKSVQYSVYRLSVVSDCVNVITFLPFNFLKFD